MYVRVHHPLKQGLRLWSNIIELDLSVVRVHHPLKQGLRQYLYKSDKELYLCTSASSIKTRIKTLCFMLDAKCNL